MYSDIFYLQKIKKYNLPFYNLEYLKNNLINLTVKEKYKIRKICNKNIELLTYDILALLNVYKHFMEDQIAMDYINKTR